MKAIWNRIESGLAAKEPEILNNLQPGATDEAIKAAEKFLKIEFPEDVKSSYRIHNGQFEWRPSLIPYWQLLGLGDAIKEWGSWKKLQDSGGNFKEENENYRSSSSDSKIRTELWWNPKWIPIASEVGGDNLCVDLDPAPAGKVGQIIVTCRDDDRRYVVAKSWQELLEQLAADLETGEYDFKYRQWPITTSLQSRSMPDFSSIQQQLDRVMSSADLPEF